MSKGSRKRVEVIIGWIKTVGDCGGAAIGDWNEPKPGVMRGEYLQPAAPGTAGDRGVKDRRKPASSPVRGADRKP